MNGAHDVGGVEDVAELVSSQAVGAGIPGVEFSAHLGPAVFVPGERRTGEAKVASKGRHSVARVGHFQNMRHDKG